MDSTFGILKLNLVSLERKKKNISFPEKVVVSLFIIKKL